MDHSHHGFTYFFFSKHGFTLIEMLIGLLGLMLVVSISSQYIYLLNEIDVQNSIQQTDIRLKQLELEFNVSYNHKFDNGKLCMDKFNQNYCFFIDHQNRLIKEPGYEIQLNDVKSLDFIDFPSSFKVTLYLETKHYDIFIQK